MTPQRARVGERVQLQHHATSSGGPVIFIRLGYSRSYWPTGTLSARLSENPLMTVTQVGLPRRKAHRTTWTERRKTACLKLSLSTSRNLLSDSIIHLQYCSLHCSLIFLRSETELSLLFYR
jgi:hypothetical protein